MVDLNDYKFALLVRKSEDAVLSGACNTVVYKYGVEQPCIQKIIIISDISTNKTRIQIDKFI